MKKQPDLLTLKIAKVFEAQAEGRFAVLALLLIVIVGGLILAAARGFGLF